MESLAVEILELIFEQLSSVKDLNSCSKTCMKWNQIVDEMYKKNSKFKTFMHYMLISSMVFLNIFFFFNL